MQKLTKKIRENNESFYDFPVDGKFPWTYNLWAGTYQISQTTYLNDEIKNVHEQTIRLDFELIIDYHYQFQFTAFDFRKNGEASESKASTLAKMCMENIYPIRMIVNSKAKIIAVELIRNPNGFLQNWKQ